MKSYSFRVIIEPDEKGAFHGYVPVLRGCHTWGYSIDETRRNAREAIDVYVRSLIADGEPVPRDLGLETIETIETPTLKRKRQPAYA